MIRLWPRDMTGQMMMAVALALLLVQGLGSFLVLKAQMDRREAGIVNAAAFRLTVGARGFDGNEPPHPPPPPHFRADDGRPRFHIMNSPVTPLRPGETQDAAAETLLSRILAEQDVTVRRIVVVHRDLRDDAIAGERATRLAARLGTLRKELHGDVMIAAIQLPGHRDWLVARVWSRRGIRDLAVPLIAQTAVIYLVLITAIALVMRRITRPLARLTARLEQFARTRSSDGQMEPEGPDDIRRLIEAHNAMEARISSMIDEKDVMLGAIGHDLKTPLAALRVRIESVPDDAERAKMAGTIEDIVRSLDDMLSLARVGRPGDPPERVELSALVASIVDEYEDMGDPVELLETHRKVLTVRQTWLRRALRNLIDNAVRYGDRARVSMIEEAGQVRLCVDDDGPGIPADSIAAMMAPFQRGDPSRNSGTGGAGLGLALARAIAEEHGGKLCLSNRPEGGLRAETVLPG